MMSTLCQASLLLLLVILSFIPRIRATPIWRCPPFKLIPCKTLPRDCTSYRMIYIRHVHLECPACLICADPLIPKPFTVVQESTTSNDAKSKETRRQRRRRLKKRKERKERRKGRTTRDKTPRDDSERVKRRRKRRKERQQRLAAENLKVKT